MTDREQTHLDNRLDKIDSAIETIRRGVYGDHQNKVLGLIDYQQDHHDRIKSLEDSRKKVLYWLGGASAIVILVVEIFHWITH